MTRIVHLLNFLPCSQTSLAPCRCKFLAYSHNLSKQRCVALQERCRALIKTKPTMAELVKLDGEAEDLPGIIPEMDALNR